MFAVREEAAPGKVAGAEALGRVAVDAEGAALDAEGAALDAEGAAVGATLVALPASKELKEGATVGWLAMMVEVWLTGAPVGEELAVTVLTRVMVEVM